MMCFIVHNYGFYKSKNIHFLQETKLFVNKFIDHDFLALNFHLYDSDGASAFPL